MLTEVYKNLYVGGLEALSHVTSDTSEKWAIVHATNAVRPDKEQSPRPLVVQRDDQLYLDWVDGPAEFYQKGGPAVFKQILDFIEAELKHKKVLVHCNFGESRSPTLALLYLAKRANVITDESYDKAREEFAKLYPNYFPSGIRVYVREHWGELK